MNGLAVLLGILFVPLGVLGFSTPQAFLQTARPFVETSLGLWVVAASAWSSSWPA